MSVQSIVQVHLPGILCKVHRFYPTGPSQNHCQNDCRWREAILGTWGDRDGLGWLWQLEHGCLSSCPWRHPQCCCSHPHHQQREWSNHLGTGVQVGQAHRSPEEYPDQHCSEQFLQWQSHLLQSEQGHVVYFSWPWSAWSCFWCRRNLIRLGWLHKVWYFQCANRRLSGFLGHQYSGLQNLPIVAHPTSAWLLETFWKMPCSLSLPSQHANCEQ